MDSDAAAIRYILASHAMGQGRRSREAMNIQDLIDIQAAAAGLEEGTLGGPMYRDLGIPKAPRPAIRPNLHWRSKGYRLAKIIRPIGMSGGKRYKPEP